MESCAGGKGEARGQEALRKRAGPEADGHPEEHACRGGVLDVDRVVFAAGKVRRVVAGTGRGDGGVGVGVTWGLRTTSGQKRHSHLTGLVYCDAHRKTSPNGI